MRERGDANRLDCAPSFYVPAYPGPVERAAGAARSLAGEPREGLAETRVLRPSARETLGFPSARKRDGQRDGGEARGARSDARSLGESIGRAEDERRRCCESDAVLRKEALDRPTDAGRVAKHLFLPCRGEHWLARAQRRARGAGPGRALRYAGREREGGRRLRLAQKGLVRRDTHVMSASSVIERLGFSGRLADPSRLPMYLISAMLDGARTSSDLMTTRTPRPLRAPNPARA